MAMGIVLVAVVVVLTLAVLVAVVVVLALAVLVAINIVRILLFFGVELLFGVEAMDIGVRSVIQTDPPKASAATTITNITITIVNSGCFCLFFAVAFCCPSSVSLTRDAVIVQTVSTWVHHSEYNHNRRYIQKETTFKCMQLITVLTEAYFPGSHVCGCTFSSALKNCSTE